MKAVGLLSGGLDSTLAVRVMQEQGVEVLAFNMVTPFCTCTKKGCTSEACKVAKNFGIPLHVVSAGRDYIELIRDPPHGRGRNMNPCIDCRIHLFRKARAHMDEVGASFLFTGEVLGQRPMSQRMDAMRLIDREAGVDGSVLRPLSARVLPPTIPELNGWVDRSRLLAITGRGRREQMSMAADRGINDYPCPAGGCRLTDPNYARRLREAFDHDEDDWTTLKLLRHGRHFRLPGGSRLVVGRDEEDNRAIASLAQERDVLLEAEGVPGPASLLRGPFTESDMGLAASICGRYSDAPGPNTRVLAVEAGGGRALDVQKALDGDIAPLHIG